MVETIKKFALVFTCIVCAVIIYYKVDAIRMGGFIMFPVILSSLFAFAVIFAKLRQFSNGRIDMDGFLKSIFECIERNRIKEAIDLCDRSPSPAAYVLRIGIMKYDRSKDEIKEALEGSFMEVVPVFEDGFSTLSSIIQIVPLLGFLGVVIAMVHGLQIMQATGASFVGCRTQDFTSCVWEALICSAISLTVAIVLLVAYNFLTAKSAAFIDEMERGCMRLSNFLLERRGSLDV